MFPSFFYFYWSGTRKCVFDRACTVLGRLKWTDCAVPVACGTRRIKDREWLRETWSWTDVAKASCWGGWWLVLAGWGDERGLCPRIPLRGSLHIDGGDGGHETALKEAVGVRRLVLTVQFAPEKMLAETLRPGGSGSLTRTLLRTYGRGQRPKQTHKISQIRLTWGKSGSIISYGCIQGKAWHEKIEAQIVDAISHLYNSHEEVATSILGRVK